MPLTERIMEAIGLKTHESVAEVKHTNFVIQEYVWLKALPVSTCIVLGMLKCARMSCD